VGNKQKSSGLMLYHIRSHPLLGILAVVTVCLVSMLVLEVLLLGGMPEIHPQASGLPQNHALLDEQGIHKPKSMFQDIVKRPMFYKDRASLNVRSVAKAGPLSDWLLTGIVLAEQKYALLENPKRVKNKAKDRRIKLTIKEKIPDGDWTLIDIQKNTAIFQSGEKTETLELKLPDKNPRKQKGLIRR